MGILNVTPDSFSDGGRHAGPEAAQVQAQRLIAEGADIIDVGGESTRPGAEPVGLEAEIGRVVPVIEALRSDWDGLISIDTMKPGVARAALEAGADIVNDVSGLRDPEMIGVCVDSGCGVVAMHMQGEPRTMQMAPVYEDVVAELRDYFAERLQCFLEAGMDPECVAFDPGIGFGKSLEHNLQLIRGLEGLQVGDRPLLIGLSRKSFIGKLLESDRMEDREWPTVALTAWTRESGARIHRVHDVRPNREALRMVEAVMHGVDD
ncbi:dihydropteroate synthase [Haloferula rosea]|nr:dihydropteroate synthase [Haloferula rosea]